MSFRPTLRDINGETLFRPQSDINLCYPYFYANPYFLPFISRYFLSPLLIVCLPRSPLVLLSLGLRNDYMNQSSSLCLSRPCQTYPTNLQRVNPSKGLLLETVTLQSPVHLLLLVSFPDRRFRRIIDLFILVTRNCRSCSSSIRRLGFLCFRIQD